MSRQVHVVRFAHLPSSAPPNIEVGKRRVRVTSLQVHLFNQFGRLRTVVPDGAGGLYVMTSNCDGRGVCPPQGDVLLRITAG